MEIELVNYAPRAETVSRPSLLDVGCGFTLALVVAVVVTAMYLHSSGPWSSVSSPTSNELLSVAMASPTDGWAVGDSGTILHYSRGTWSKASSPTGLILFSVAMVSSTDGWAVGEAGTILHYRDGAWSIVSSPIKLLFSVFMISPTDGWAVGGSGVILHYSGG